MKKNKTSLLLAIPAASLAFAATSKAVTVFTDNFTAGMTLADNGWYAYNNSSAGALWSKPTLASTTTGSELTGAVMRNQGGSAANTIMTKQWSVITLANTGDYLTLTLDIQTNSTAGTLGISILDAAAFTANSLGGATSPTAGADGYGYSQGYASTGMTYRSYTGGTAANLNTATGTTALGTTGSVGRTLIYTITRTSTGLSLDSSVNGTAFTTQAVASPVTYDFNSLTMTSFGLNSAVNFDNILLTTNVPEPSTFALAFGSLGMLFFRRRRAN